MPSAPQAWGLTLKIPLRGPQWPGEPVILLMVASSDVLDSSAARTRGLVNSGSRTRSPVNGYDEQPAAMARRRRSTPLHGAPRRVIGGGRRP